MKGSLFRRLPAFLALASVGAFGACDDPEPTVVRVPASVTGGQNAGGGAGLSAGAGSGTTSVGGAATGGTSVGGTAAVGGSAGAAGGTSVGGTSAVGGSAGAATGGTSVGGTAGTGGTSIGGTAGSGGAAGEAAEGGAGGAGSSGAAGASAQSCSENAMGFCTSGQPGVSCCQVRGALLDLEAACWRGDLSTTPTFGPPVEQTLLRCSDGLCIVQSLGCYRLTRDGRQVKAWTPSFIIHGLAAATAGTDIRACDEDERKTYAADLALPVCP